MNGNCGQKKGTKYEEEGKLQTGNNTQKSENIKNSPLYDLTLKKTKESGKHISFLFVEYLVFRWLGPPTHMLALSKTDKTNGDNSVSVIKT